MEASFIRDFPMPTPMDILRYQEEFMKLDVISRLCGVPKMEKWQADVMKLVMSGKKVVYMQPSRIQLNRELTKWNLIYHELKGSTSGKMKDYNPDATSIKDLFGDA